MTQGAMDQAAATELILRKKLADAEQKLVLYEAIINRLDVGIHVVDKQGKTIVYNAMMAKLEGEDPHDILGRPLLEAMPYLKGENSTLLTALKGGEPLNDRQQTYINAHGKQIVTVNSTTPLFFQGVVSGALEIAKDITFIQALAEKIVDLQQNLCSRKKPGSHAPNTRYTFAEILGQSEAIITVVQYAMRAARTASNILIYGETGTGKELFAQSIHNSSPRKSQPFIAVNCAALPEQLLEGLLFGTTKGGFTGAVDRPGLFEQAHGGTLLLDELNSMNLDLQAKLLRVLQENSVRRLGATHEIPIDVRIVATLNADPVEAMQERCLREDLYYRLGVVTLHIPALRERKSDIGIYVNEFIEKYNERLALRVKGISWEVMAAFHQYAWPGNIRELQHAIEGSMNLMWGEDEIQMQHLPMLFRSNLQMVVKPWKAQDKPDSSPNLIEHRDTVEKEMIAAAFAESGGNITQAARTLGLTRQVLQYKLKKYKLK
jgi:arginine utilization regulatory protein